MKIQKKFFVFVMVAVLSLTNLAYAASNILNDEVPSSTVVSTNPGDVTINSGGDPDPIGW